MAPLNRLLLLGATGDLAGRLLLPALSALRSAGELAPDFHYLGAGRDEWDVRDAGAMRVAVAALSDGADNPIAVYLALPTQLMAGAVAALAGAGLPLGSRIVVEKPFGASLPEAVELNRLLALAAPGGAESSIYRVDHALAMRAVRRLPRVSGAGLAQMEVLWEETLALEGRAMFYDRAGALRDVVQNHVMQVLASVIASPTERREDALRRVRTLSPEEAVASSRRARYLTGTLAGGDAADRRAVPDYADEDGVDPDRQTETFAEVTLAIDGPHWAGVPVVLRAGKALARRRRGVLLIRADGSQSLLDLDADGQGAADAEVGAYIDVLRDVLSGRSEFSVRAGEAELAWRILEPVIQVWGGGRVPLGTYAAGSFGPTD